MSNSLRVSSLTNEFPYIIQHSPTFRSDGLVRIGNAVEGPGDALVRNRSKGKSAVDSCSLGVSKRG